MTDVLLQVRYRMISIAKFLGRPVSANDFTPEETAALKNHAGRVFQTKDFTRLDSSVKRTAPSAHNRRIFLHKYVGN